MLVNLDVYATRIYEFQGSLHNWCGSSFTAAIKHRIHPDEPFHESQNGTSVATTRGAFREGYRKRPAEKEQYQVKSRKLREQIAGLNEQHYGKVGEVRQIKDPVQALKTELQTDFQDADKHYHNEWIKLQTNLLVPTDLQTYSQALDNAIMKNHSMKMDEINRILRELGTQTYRGTNTGSKSSVTLQSDTITIVGDHVSLDMEVRLNN
ncbi:hypothetical protein JCM33374_g4909 [Metschnikowia sp. JCM 33374]|nr:hypothetical protein JCM33374_g4909 [Metschnikowia sp. JCM 33374]